MNFYTDNSDLKFQLQHPLMDKIAALREKNFADKGKYTDAPQDTADAVDNYDKVLEIMGDICGNTLAANAEDVDHEGAQLTPEGVKYAAGTQINLQTLVRAGMFGMSLPRKYNGLNFSVVPYVIAAELVSRADAGFGNIWDLQGCAETIRDFASEELKDKFLPRIAQGATCSMDLTEPDAGSDLQAVALKAALDEKSGRWLLNGVKRFITNGCADIHLVLARSEEGTSDARGLSYFVYDKKDGGVTVRRIENKLGIKGSPTCELVFNNAPASLVGERKLGLIRYTMSLMNGARLGIGAQSVGICEMAYREALKFANKRSQFGKTIINFPAIYEMLTVMKAKLQGARALLYETARAVDIYKAYGFIAADRKLTPEERNEQKEYQKQADFFTPLIKLMGSEYCNQLTYDAIQIHGGSGFMKDYPIERAYRDARITTIYEGTSQLQVVAAIRGILTGAALERIKYYAAQEIRAEQKPLADILAKMTAEYEAALASVQAFENTEYVDFHARRLVEMAAHIIMGYLLLLDSKRNASFSDSAEVYIKRAATWNAERAIYITQFNIDDLATYKKMASVENL
jgi:alkylation response protein AidB-like acyl-CoA dehydrogenase